MDLSVLREKSTEIVQAGTKELVKHSPKILTAAGIVGFFTTVIMAVKAKDKADLLIDEMKAIKADEEGIDQSKRSEIKLTPLETVKAITPAYWPTAVSFVLSSAAIIGSDYISDKRQTALSAAYAIADTSLKELQKKTIEQIGPKKAADIEQKVTASRVEKDPPNTEVVKYVEANTNYTIFRIAMTGQTFTSRIEDVEGAFVRANKLINEGQEVMLNDLLYDFYSNAVNISNVGKGVHESDVGSIFYWEACGEHIQYHFSAAEVPDTHHVVCLEIHFDTAPRCYYDPRKCDVSY